MAQAPLFKVEGPHIVFGCEEMKTGTNFTVRLGADYMERKGFDVGMQVTLTTVDGGEIGQGIITHYMVCRIADIPKEVLKDEHDPKCRNPFELYHELLQCYPEADIKPHSFVTCVGFKLLG